MAAPYPAGDARLGRLMTIGAWVLALALLTWLFAQWQEGQVNPNRSLAVHHGPEGTEVALKRNRYGHYVLDGAIGGQRVTFLLDTGATTVSIPQATAQRLGLRGGAPYRVGTANGTITVYATRIPRLHIGPIELHDIAAHVNPHMEGEAVLLGMSALRHLELIQRGETLTLRAY